ncbi:succinate dehydrogenase cytochrome b subunit [Persicimonas caeni]|nr:succinate dehydrogenase cytochrome b subunit [Persicimonas caeni]
MFSLKKALRSGVARKLINGVTALGLVGFIVVHLLGNLAIFAPDKGEAFNAYSAALHDLGIGLYVLEIGLLAFFGFHAFYGIKLWLQNRKARDQRYAVKQKSKRGPSKFNLASVNMALSGLILLVFVVVHVAQFRFGLFTDTAQYENTGPTGKVFDLYGLVVDTFAHPGWVAFYCGAVLFLGFHLRHGAWSMLQTLGAMNSKWSQAIYGIGALIAVLLAAGFFVLPLYIYFFIH